MSVQAHSLMCLASARIYGSRGSFAVSRHVGIDPAKTQDKRDGKGAGGLVGEWYKSEIKSIEGVMKTAG